LEHRLRRGQTSVARLFLNINQKVEEKEEGKDLDDWKM
jgi:hypothetical protein